MASPPPSWVDVFGDFGPTLIVLEAVAVAVVLLLRDAWRRWRGRSDA